MEVNLEEDDVEPDEDEVENISAKTAANHILELRKYFSQTNEMDWDFFLKLEKKHQSVVLNNQFTKIKQTKLSDYFK